VKIALVAPLVTAIREPQLGGSQAMVADLATGLSERGHEVHLYAATGSAVAGVGVVDTGVDAGALQAFLYRDGVTRGADQSPVADAFARVYDTLRQDQYDIVHNHAFDAPAVLIAESIPWPVVHTLHLPPEPEVAAALRHAEGSAHPPTVAAVSDSHANGWRAFARIDLVLRDGVPVARIPWSAAAGTGALFAGRFSPEKGAAEAIAIARAAGVPIDLYGDPYDATYARDQVESKQAEPGVAVHGGLPRTELWRRMARALAVICAPKWEEPFGMVAAEAQATGTPVVAFRRGALHELIVDGQTGFLVAPGDIGAAAAALKQVGSLRREACRRHAELDLNLVTTLLAHERLYARLRSAAAASRG
jgi:glycosyltransferase involved in cell wall biosynthesis